MPACEGQTVGVLRVWHEQPRPDSSRVWRERSNRMCDGCMANLGRPPAPVAVCEHSAAMLALPSPPSPHPYAPPFPPYAHTLWWGAATIRAGHADTAHLHLLIKPIITGHGSSGRRSTGRGGSCAAGRQLQHMLRRRHNVGVAPRKASHEQQTAKPSSTTHHDRPDGVWPALLQVRMRR